eukprot:6193575-Pleurochrysis_carterae.AAC.1
MDSTTLSQSLAEAYSTERFLSTVDTSATPKPRETTPGSADENELARVMGQAVSQGTFPDSLPKTHFYSSEEEGYNTLKKFYYHRILAGERLLFQSGPRYFTLTLENFKRMTKKISERTMLDEYMEIDKDEGTYKSKHQKAVEAMETRAELGLGDSPENKDSDAELLQMGEDELIGSFTVSKPGEDETGLRKYSFADGEFFAHTHTIDCQH